VPGVDGYTLTADGNIIHARATLKYRIVDPVQYAFRFAAASNLLQNVLDNALVDASGRYPAEAAIYRDKIGFRDAVLDRVGEAIEQHRLGIAVDPSDVQVVAPLDVRPSFEAVLAAEQERSSKVNDARAYAAEITVRAAGESEAVLGIARGARNQMVTAVAAEAGSFGEQLPHFERNPALFARRRLTETVEQGPDQRPGQVRLPPAQPGRPAASSPPTRARARETRLPRPPQALISIPCKSPPSSVAGARFRTPMPTPPPAAPTPGKAWSNPCGNSASSSSG
jgi:regulator of protease activity HflC (stomatin/prohibitin superfamily)